MSHAVPHEQLTSREAVLMITNPNGGVVLSHAPVLKPRLHLRPRRAAGRPALDGGWWPRSEDSVSELPGLLADLHEAFGPITRIVLCASDWDFHPQRLEVDDRVVSLGWYDSQPRGLLTAAGDRIPRLDLLVVPPVTNEATAIAALTVAADPGNTLRAPEILAAMQPEPEEPEEPEATWEGEGGAA